MACDESLYHQYLSGDDAGLDALMKKYGDPLTLYLDGYLHDIHEAEELMLDVFAYKLTSTMAAAEEYAQQNKYAHRLFTADYAVTNEVVCCTCCKES